MPQRLPSRAPLTGNEAVAENDKRKPTLQSALNYRP